MPNVRRMLTLILCVAGASGAEGQDAIVKVQNPLPHPTGASHAFGAALATRGDLNGDGLRDLVVASPAHGAIHAFSGHRFGPLWAGHGSSADLFGSSLANAGDVDLDGRADIAVGVPRADVLGKSDVGIVRILSGANGASVFTLVDLSLPAQSFLAGDLAAGADVDGDGKPDLAVTRRLPPGTAGGEVRVYSGTGALLHAFGGAVLNSWSASTVEFADADGDGFVDIAVGLPYDARVQIYSGATGLPGSTIAQPPGLLGGSFGQSLANVGDIDGDGRDELFIGCPTEFTPALGAHGAVRLASSSSGAILFTHFGAQFSEFFGAAVGGGDDLDGDGVPDVVAGGPRYELAGLSGPQGRAVALSGATGAVIWNAVGMTDGEALGTAVATYRDVDQNGASEAIASAPSFAVDAAPTFGEVRVIADADCGLIASHGAGCGTSLMSPGLDVLGCPHSGGVVTIAISDLYQPTIAVFVFGIAAATVPLPFSGCFLNVGGLMPFTPSIPVGPDSVVPQGFSVALPAVAIPFTFHAQAFVRDPWLNATTATNGVAVTIEP